MSGVERGSWSAAFEPPLGSI